MYFITVKKGHKLGRDFYDSIFLLSKTQPNYGFLKAKIRVASLDDLKVRIGEVLQTVDLQQKKRDFQHLLFNEANAERILQFNSFIRSLK